MNMILWAMTIQNIVIAVRHVNKIAEMTFKRKHTRPVFWVILSPEYDSNHGSYEDPPEWGRDCMYVRAKSAHRAKVLAIRAWRKRWWQLKCYRKPYIVYYNDENPMAVLTIHRCLLTGETVNTRVL